MDARGSRRDTNFSVFQILDSYQRITVCIAAMYMNRNGRYGLWAAADRMLTGHPSGLKSEPDMDKTFPLNRRCMLFGAGDSLDDRPLWVTTRVVANDEMPIQRIVEIYQQAYIARLSP
jgi:hypothetical protein